MLFTGSAEVSIDAKQRLAMPAKFRDRSKTEGERDIWYCVHRDDRLLQLYPESKFLELSSKLDESLFPQADQSRLESDFFGSVERIESDTAGRITIPRNLLEDSGLGMDVVVIGAKHKLEIRDRAAWNAGKPERIEALKKITDARSL